MLPVQFRSEKYCKPLESSRATGKKEIHSYTLFCIMRKPGYPPNPLRVIGELQFLTFVPRSVKAIAMLFFAISKFGDTAKHLFNANKQA